MLLWLATITQPELFEDINMVEEIKYYYKEFYEYELTDEQAQRVLDGWYERQGMNPTYDEYRKRKATGNKHTTY